jgi:hypothetical protein
VSGELVIGRLMKIEQARNETVWRWYLNAISGPSTEVRTSGHEPSLDAAKEAIAVNWRKWVALAGLREDNSRVDFLELGQCQPFSQAVSNRGFRFFKISCVPRGLMWRIEPCLRVINWI